MDVSSTTATAKQRRLPNPFLLKVIQDWGPSSPVAHTKDEAQPSTGSLRTLHSDLPAMLTLKPGNTAGGVSSQDILKCKSMNNEDLIPALHQEVKLTIGSSKLLQKRSRRTL